MFATVYLIESDSKLEIRFQLKKASLRRRDLLLSNRFVHCDIKEQMTGYTGVGYSEISFMRRASKRKKRDLCAVAQGF